MGEKIEWRHFNTINSSFAYIEGLLINMENDISGKKQIYTLIHNNLKDEQIQLIKHEIKKIRTLLKKAKKEFDLEPKKFSLSHTIDVNCNFLWSTIDDIWSYKLEKSSGKISSQKNKESLDEILDNLCEYTNQIKRILDGYNEKNC
ncbi:MAG: hypothetical protein APG10_01280 [Candidatus Methanofastidiosum methylothiophilum]|uniref:Uncharacterized protein n=1 Tax=Candidatus Methanofastidiosum methylothiophilum TaxID=1705564 RepID=A0A150IJX3_9EURY|nr:MAG: hypothetical protein APG10_01280 [Candidatus Methanofastidiosum methylthiophilus]